MIRKTPQTKKLEASQVKKATDMAASGAPPRIIALALGFTVPQYKGWLLVGQEEDAYEEETGGARDIPMERVFAMEMYRAISKAEAGFAVKLMQRMKKAMLKGDMWSARWWLEKRVNEFSAKPVGNAASAAVKTVFYTPSNGRMPK